MAETWVVCDNCDEPFEIEAIEPGGKVACPRCGDVNRVPRAGQEEPAERPRPRPRAEEPPPARTAQEGERQICVVRPAMFRAHPFRYALVLLLVIGGAVLAITAAAVEAVAIWLLWPGVLLGAAGLVWFGLWWASTHWWVKLVISNKRTVRHEGVIRRHTTEVLHDHVRSVDIRQSFIQRILRTGSIGIDSAGQEDIEIEVHDIPGPYEVKRIIDQYRHM